MDDCIVLHIGSQRTGSTFLQRCIFNRIDFFKYGIYFESNENIWSDIWYKGDDRWCRLSVLINMFPDAHIIFGTRNEWALLNSLYKKYVIQGGTLPFSKFNTVINMDKLCHKLYIDELHKAFKHVFIYEYEDLCRDVMGVVDDMCSFIGVEMPKFCKKRYNVGYGYVMLPIARQLNKIFRNDFNQHGLIPCHYYRLPHRFFYQEIFMPLFNRL